MLAKQKAKTVSEKTIKNGMNEVVSWEMFFTTEVYASNVFCMKENFLFFITKLVRTARPHFIRSVPVVKPREKERQACHSLKTDISLGEKNTDIRKHKWTVSGRQLPQNQPRESPPTLKKVRKKESDKLVLRDFSFSVYTEKIPSPSHFVCRP